MGLRVVIGEIAGQDLPREALLKALCDEFHRYFVVIPEYVIEAECWLEGDKDSIYEWFGGDWAWEDIGESLVVKLIENLEEVAPEGVYFGIQDGRYGWWGDES